MRRAEGRQDGCVDNYRHERDEGRDEIGYGWERENERREGPPCGVGDKGEAERSGGGKDMGGDGGELA